MATARKNPFLNVLQILRYEKKEITAIYFYALFNGLVALSLPLGIQSIISFVLGGAVSTSLILLIIFVIAGVFFNGLLQVNQIKVIEKIQQQLFVRYSFQYAQAIPHLNLKETDNYYLPELANRFFDTVSLQKGISKLLLDIPAATIQVVFGLILLSFYHPVFILFGVLLITVLYIIIRITGNKGLQTSLEESNYKYGVAGYLQELARAVLSFKFSLNHSLHLRKTDHYVTGHLHARTNHFRVLLIQYWTLIGFKLLITAAMLIVGVSLLLDQQINIGQFIAAEIVILTIIASVEKLIVNLDSVYDVITSVEKLETLIHKPKETGGALLPDNTTKGLSVRFIDCSFSYQEGQKILKNLSFAVEAGEKVCVMGSDGSGKSTLLRVLSGAYAPFDGRVCINGIDMAMYDKLALRTRMSVLLNQQDLFQGTILENITMGSQGLTAQKVMAFLKEAGLSQLLSDGDSFSDIPLKATGQHISQKLKQKILLLRALIRMPALALLEEPWLGMEEADAQVVKAYLLNRNTESTLIVVSNDASFARQCDKVLLLEDGAVKAYGNWQEIQKMIPYA